MNTHKRLVVAAGLALLAAAAAADDLDGQWHTRVSLGPEAVNMSLEISNGTYIFVVESTQSMHTGEIQVIAPDTLRLVVQDFEPKVFEGVSQQAPPDSYYTILENDGERLVLLDRSCAEVLRESACQMVWQRQ